MPVRLLAADEPLPPPESADPRGLVAVGGDLSSERLLDGYRRGIFPWYEDGLPILWHSPNPRFVLRPEELIVNRSLRKALRRGAFELSLDRAFPQVIRACAGVTRPGQEGTWITTEMVDAYCELHELGHAHSVEAWSDGLMVGGLYGVRVGSVFCGESMFSLIPDASKVAFVHFVRQLEAWGFSIIDCQVHTAHLERFGARQWPRDRFLEALAEHADEDVSAPEPWAFDETLDLRL